MKYDLPNFKRWKPKKLSLELDKIEKRYNSIIFSQDTDILNNIIIKVFNKKKLSQKELSTVFFNYPEIREIVDFEKGYNKEFFLNQIKENFIDMSGKNIVDIFGLLYKNILLDDKDIEEEIQSISSFYLNNISLDYDSLSTLDKIFYEYIFSKQDIISFLEGNFFLYVKSESDYKYFSILYRIGNETTIYTKIINFYFDNRLSNILEENNGDYSIKNIDIFKDNISSIQEKIKIYINIFNYYIENKISTEDYSNEWFGVILDTLGKPGDNPLWNSFEEIHRIMFNRWLIYKKLKKIFVYSVKATERLEFWKGYLASIKNVEFFEDIDQAIVMEFSNHTIIEFGIKPNPIIIYQSEILNIKKFEIMKRNYTKRRLMWKLKNNKPLKKINHVGNWQYQFKLELSRLNYNIGENHV